MDIEITDNVMAEFFIWPMTNDRGVLLIMKTRILLTAAILLLACGVWADNIIFVPRGTTLTTGQFRGQFLFSQTGDDGNFHTFSIGLKQLEFQYTHAEYVNGRKEELMGGQWNVLPETFITPAIGIGVRDVWSRSKEGIGIYGALTKHIPIQNYTRYADDFSVTLGVGARSIHGFFCGGEVKLPLYFVGQVEFDGENWNTALCWQPAETFRLKVAGVKSKRYYGAEFTPLEF